MMAQPNRQSQLMCNRMESSETKCIENYAKLITLLNSQSVYFIGICRVTTVVRSMLKTIFYVSSASLTNSAILTISAFLTNSVTCKHNNIPIHYICNRESKKIHVYPQKLSLHAQISFKVPDFKLRISISFGCQFLKWNFLEIRFLDSYIDFT